ncbi:MAG TPA: hypothetical protein VFE70_02120 [Candidatus Elarobacter sp.]|jgi:hypothetical protein|nr:hypothetical protein [Candidatus Elarobacter sp.]
MNRLLLAVALALATTTAAFAQATTPIGKPPPPGRPTANLVLDAMMATARAAATNPAAAQAASLNTSAAIERYNMGDLNGARAAAIQALIEANRAQPGTTIPILQSTIPQTSALQTQPFPLAGGSVGAIDAHAFVAQARGAVAACASRNSANTAAATQHLTSAQRDEQAGHYLDVITEARAAVDLCAAAQRAINAVP